jgi:short subunit dehydrogenase-like uncharacterized protein
MITVIGVKKIQLFECVSTSFGFLAKRRNHPRNGRQRENPTFYESIAIDYLRESGQLTSF